MASYPKTFAEAGIHLPPGASGEVTIQCPQCGPKRRKKYAKSLSVNTTKGVWICHNGNCGWKGGLNKASSFYKDAFAPDEVLEAKPPAKAKLITDATISPQGQAAYQYLLGRGLTPEVLNRNQIKWAPFFSKNEEDWTKENGGWIGGMAFPYYEPETSQLTEPAPEPLPPEWLTSLPKKLVNFKYRTVDKQMRFQGGCKITLYGLCDIEFDEVFIVEGELDKLAVEVAGITSCVSVPHGAPAKETKNYSAKFDWIAGCQQWLAPVKTFTLAVDNDEPGKVLEEELLHRLGKYRCKRVRWPEGCKDANDVLLKHGKEALLLALINAEPYPVAGAIHVLDRYNEVLELYERGGKPGLTTGWPSLDSIYRISSGEITIVTGMPNHGKSTWLNNLMMNLTKHHDWSIALFSPESQPIERHISRLVEMETNKRFSSYRKAQLNPPMGTEFQHTSLLKPEELKASLARLNDHFTFIQSPDEVNTLPFIFETAANLVMQKGIRGLIIDPWNEIEHERKPSLTETEYISQCLSQIRRFTRKHNLHTWLVAHPTKLSPIQKKVTLNGEEQTKNVYPVPTPYNIAGSAHFYNKADNCVAFWRDVLDDHRPCEVHVQKIRNQDANGKPGVCHLVYNPNERVFKCLNPRADVERALYGNTS